MMKKLRTLCLILGVSLSLLSSVSAANEIKAPKTIDASKICKILENSTRQYTILSGFRIKSYPSALEKIHKGNLETLSHFPDWFLEGTSDLVLSLQESYDQSVEKKGAPILVTGLSYYGQMENVYGQLRKKVISVLTEKDFSVIEKLSDTVGMFLKQKQAFHILLLRVEATQSRNAINKLTKILKCSSNASRMEKPKKSISPKKIHFPVYTT